MRGRGPTLREWFERWTVRRLLAVTMVGTGLVIIALGLIGSFAVHETTQTVDTLSREVSPAQVANAEFMEAMLDAETELRAYLISGEARQLSDHRAALARVPAAEAALETYVRQHHELAGLVRQQDELAREWVEDFAVVAAADGSAADRNKPLFDLGVRHFDAVKQVNAIIDTRLRLDVATARDEAQKRLDETFALIAVLGVLGALLCTFLGWRVVRGIRRPIADLSRVVDRLAMGEYDARATIAGPAEIRRLGLAVNEMAEETSRARAVEQQIQERLLEVDRVKSEFVSNVSHELRTPLTSIAGYLELLSEKLGRDADPEDTEMMLVMQRNVARLGTLIEDLLDLGSIERQPDRLQSVDVARLVEDAARDLRLSAGSRQVTISIETAPGADQALVLADGAQLHRALLNLLSNAVKFSYDGGDVRLRLGATDEQVEVHVTDTGIGIPDGDQGKVGERFYRASNAVTAHIPGTGLGLRMVQAIISHHHGTFVLSSEEGRGTTATIRLPRQRTSDPVVVVQPEQNRVPQR